MPTTTNTPAQSVDVLREALKIGARCARELAHRTGSIRETRDRIADEHTIDAALALLPEGCQIVGPWQPFSSVPRDGVPVLLLLEEPMIGSLIHAGRFHERMPKGTIGAVLGFDAPRPTHWMPMLAASAPQPDPTP